MKKAKKKKFKKTMAKSDFTRMQKGNVPDQGVKAPPVAYRVQQRNAGRGR